MINANIFNNNPALKLLIQQIQSQQNNLNQQTYEPQPIIIQTGNNTANFPVNQTTESINNKQPNIDNTLIAAYDQKQTKFMSESFTNHRSNNVISFPQNNGYNTAMKKNSSGNLKQQRNSLTQQHNRNKSKGGNFRETIISSNFILTNKHKKSKSITNLGHNKQQTKKIGINHKFRVSQVTKKDTNKDKQVRQNSKKSVSAFSFHSNQPIPEQIIKYIKKRQDVEIAQYFQQYKKQFYIKSKILHDYIESTDQPQKVRNIYLNQNDIHFRNGLQAIMLKLFRNGTIVPQSYTNLRQQAVQEIQKWVIGWIHRKIMYGKLQQDQQNQVLMVEDALKHLQDYRKFINSQDTSF